MQLNLITGLHIYIYRARWNHRRSSSCTAWT